MFKNLLVASLALLTVGTANSFERKASKVESDRFTAFPGMIEQPNRLNTRAEGDASSIDFSVADPVYTAYKLNNVKVGDEVYLAFEMSSENSTIFANDEITSINITTGAYVVGQSYMNSVTDVKVFITEDLQKDPVYTQSGTLGTSGFTTYKVPLTTPYKIEAGKSFYVGYSFKVPNSQQYYVPVDGIVTDNTEGGWFGLISNGAVSWNNLASEIGSICIGCTLKGENFPQNNVIFNDFYGPVYTAPGAQFQYLFLLQSKGTTASNVEIEYTVGDAAPQTLTSNLINPETEQPITVGYNEYGVVVIPLTCNTEGISVPMTFKITKVDGVDNNAKDNTFVAAIDCFEASKGFPRVHVIEEGTGITCGWCPGGIVMMEYINEKYPDIFACVALHTYVTGPDPMQASSASDVLKNLFSGYPQAYIDRTYNILQLQYASEAGTKTEIDEYVAAYKDIPAAIGFPELTATMLDNGNLVAETKVKSSFDIANNNRYRLAYYLTQNNVGPYNQTNYFAGGGNGVMGGWERKGSKVETYFDDVCRYLLGGFYGISNSLPAQIKGGEEVSYTAEIPTSTVNAAEFFLTAFIVDSTTGEIVNAKQIKVEKEWDAAVNEIGADATPVSKKYYSVSGVEVKNPSNGIYIVRTSYSDGTVKTSKEALK